MIEDYKTKFSKLPSQIKDQVGSQTSVDKLSELEAQYSVKQLASLIMRVLVRDVKLSQVDVALSERGAKGDLTKLREEFLSGFITPFISLVEDEENTDDYPLDQQCYKSQDHAYSHG